MKTYVLTISKYFLTAHPRAGEETCFMTKIWKDEKKHTIRGNYELWKRRAEEVNKGNAIISVRTWHDKPYRSTQKPQFNLEKVVVQKLEMTMLGWFIDDTETDYTTADIAANDGLSTKDFCDWFKKYPKEPMAIIQLNNFKY